MLGKLLKHEFYAVSKVYLPLYALVLLLAAVNKVMMLFAPQNTIDLPQGILMTAYIMLLTAIIVVSFTMGILRFKKNLLNDEGYLMFTLPVARWQLILSKTISAVAWSVFSIIVGILSGVILSWTQMPTFSINFVSGEIGYILLSLAMLMVAILLGMAASYLTVYLSLALGHTSNNSNKVAMSVLAYFGITFIVQIIGLQFIFNSSNIIHLFVNVKLSVLPFVVLGVVIVCISVYDAICFFLTNYILKTRLNLE